MIKIFQGCLVVRLWRSSFKQVELCMFPPFKRIDYHYHKLEDIEVCHLWGVANYYRLHNYKVAAYKTRIFRDFGRCFSVPRLALHAATVSWTGLVTLSIQNWHGVKQTSVTTDYFSGEGLTII